jgi:hypothetical protein
MAFFIICFIQVGDATILDKATGFMDQITKEAPRSGFTLKTLTGMEALLSAASDTQSLIC